MKVQNLRKMELSASYPLEAYKSGPYMKVEIFFRTGRPVETHLDNGTLPPFPDLPKNFTMKDLISEVVKHAVVVINPDIGTIEELDNKSLLDLYACAFEEVKKYPELLKILDEAFKEKVAYTSWLFPYEKKLSDYTGWIEQDALKVLEAPTLADKLAEKISVQFEPYKEMYYAKEDIQLKEPDLKSISPHAFAVAGLSKANAEKYAKLIQSKIEHLINVHNANNPSNWALDEIIKTGQTLKLVAIYSQNKHTKKMTNEIVQTLKKEAFQRFINEHKKFSLHQKIEVAHLISDVWYPYLNMPESLIIEPPDESKITQRMAPGWGGRDITAEVLEETRLLYKSALEHAIEKMKHSNWSLSEKKIWMENFLDEWYKYLFNAHKGGYLQPYEKELEKDRIRALKDIEQP
jgi:hypothetical protein